MGLRQTSDDGMSLIEVVVAMAIITVGLLGMLTEIVAYFHQQTTQRAHAVALRIATTTLEDARRLSPSSLAQGTVTAPGGVWSAITATAPRRTASAANVRPS